MCDTMGGACSTCQTGFYLSGANTCTGLMSILLPFIHLHLPLHPIQHFASRSLRQSSFTPLPLHSLHSFTSFTPSPPSPPFWLVIWVRLGFPDLHQDVASTTASQGNILIPHPAEVQVAAACVCTRKFHFFFLIINSLHMYRSHLP